MKKIKHKKLGLQITTGIALAIIFFGLINLGVYAFYPQPEYEDYCSYDLQIINYATCSEEYQSDLKDYDNNVFYIFVLFGLVLAILGLFLTYLPFQIVGIGAGSASIVEGIIRNLDNKIMAFFAGLIVFAILAWFVYKKVKD